MERDRISLGQILLVTLVLGAFGALLYPLFAPARMGHSPTSDLTKLKMISLGSLIYASDYEEWIPPYSSFDLRETDGPLILQGRQERWKACLMPYIKREDYFFTLSWPFPKERPLYAKMQPVAAARGAVDGASSFGHAADITPRFFGTPEGNLRLNLATPPPDFLDLHGGRAESAPLYEDLAWFSKDAFGRKSLVRNSPSKKGRQVRLVAFFDGSAREEPDSVKPSNRLE
mgnify:CR=1 FL=1